MTLLRVNLYLQVAQVVSSTHLPIEEKARLLHRHSMDLQQTIHSIFTNPVVNYFAKILLDAKTIMHPYIACWRYCLLA